MFYQAGAVKNWYVEKYSDYSTEQLEQSVRDWESRTLLRKVLGHLNPFEDWDMKISAIRKIISDRADS